MKNLSRRRWSERDVAERKPRRVDGVPPPHDLGAERAVLASALSDAGAAESAAALLAPDDFYDLDNARVFEAIVALVREHQSPETVSVTSWLTAREWPEPRGKSVSWNGFVRELYYGGTDTDHPGVYAERWIGVVAAKGRRRRVLAACHRVVSEGYFDVGDEQEWLDGVASTMAEYAQPPERQIAEPMSAIVKAAFEAIVATFDAGKAFDGIPTGYDRLDSKIAGLHEGDLVIVAARPGMGKTALVMNMAVNVASPREMSSEGRTWHERGKGVAVFSLEMPKAQLATRMVCSEARVDLGRLRQGLLHQNDWTKLTEASTYLQTLPIWIDDTPAIGLLELRAKVRQFQAKHNRPATSKGPEERVGLVIVDYLQLMKGREDAQSREQEISEISRGLKALAKELKVPVIALSQLNRSVETRSTKDKRPQLSDLRESGAIEQDADTIIFIYRDDYYNPETSDLKGIAELIVAKQRNGPTGKVKVRFAAACTRFDNLEPGHVDSAEDE